MDDGGRTVDGDGQTFEIEARDDARPEERVTVMDEKELRELLTYGKNHAASDVHFRPGVPPVFRIGGRLLMLKSGRLTASDTEDIALAAATNPPDFQRALHFE